MRCVNPVKALLMTATKIKMKLLLNALREKLHKQYSRKHFSFGILLQICEITIGIREDYNQMLKTIQNELLKLLRMLSPDYELRL